MVTCRWPIHPTRGRSRTNNDVNMQPPRPFGTALAALPSVSLPAGEHGVALFLMADEALTEGAHAALRRSEVRRPSQPPAPPHLHERTSLHAERPRRGRRAVPLGVQRRCSTGSRGPHDGHTGRASNDKMLLNCIACTMPLLSADDPQFDYKVRELAAEVSPCACAGDAAVGRAAGGRRERRGRGRGGAPDSSRTQRRR